MIYKSHIKTLVRFNENIAKEYISDDLMNSVGSDEDIIIANESYQMKANQYLQSESLLVDIGDMGFSLFFGLEPVNKKEVVNPFNKNIESLICPIIEIKDIITGNIVCKIEELSSSSNKNLLKVTILSNNSPQDIIFTVSNPYICDKKHYFFIDVNVKKNDINIFIDGEKQNTSVVGDPIAELNIGLINFYINKIEDNDYDYNYSHNTGFISDIIVMNTQINIDEVLSELLNQSIDDFVLLSNYQVENSFFGSLFNDPTTLKINAVVDDMTYIYLARNDGCILRGGSLLWESRRVFSDEREKNTIKDFITNIEDGTGASVKNGFLHLKDSFVRL